MQDTNEHPSHSMDEHFEWVKESGKYILHMDSSNLDDTNQDMGMALCHRCTHQYDLIPEGNDGVKRLCINLTNSKVHMKTFYELYSYFKVKSYSDVICVYGAYTNPIIIALVKAVSPYLKSKARIFKTKKEAFAYLASY